MSSCGKNENPQEMNRRKFLKVFGGGAVASSAALYGCAPKNEPGAAVALGEVPTDKMTYRQHPTNGDKVSHWHAILGTPIIWPLNCQTSRTIREKTRWRCIGSRSVICKPIIWIIICFTLSVGGMVSSFSMTAI